jgi:hypothetical protein
MDKAPTKAKESDMEERTMLIIRVVVTTSNRKFRAKSRLLDKECPKWI